MHKSHKKKQRAEGSSAWRRWSSTRSCGTHENSEVYSKFEDDKCVRLRVRLLLGTCWALRFGCRGCQESRRWMHTRVSGASAATAITDSTLVHVTPHTRGGAMSRRRQERYNEGSGEYREGGASENHGWAARMH